MASNILIEPRIEPGDDLPFRRPAPSDNPALQVLHVLASLKLTIALFSLAIFLIFAGTLAQTRMNIQQVLEVYFRTPLAWIEFQSLFPENFFPSWQGMSGGFYFPGGFTIGAVMFINLLAAHGLKFKVQASGNRLYAGLGVIAIGCLMTWAVVAGGSDKQGFDGSGTRDWTGLWNVMQAALVLTWVGNLVVLSMLPAWRKFEWWTLLTTAIILGGVIGWLIARFISGNAVVMEGASMRILWQLTKASIAGGVLLAGSIMVFKKRAGVVVLHAGILLMMTNEMVVHTLHREGFLRASEGESVNFVRETSHVELAVVDPSGKDTDSVVVVPRSHLEVGKKIENELLPFDIKVERWLQNSDLRRLRAGDDNLANKGLGLGQFAEPRKAGIGVGDSKIDQTSAYVSLLDKETGKPLGTYLLTVDSTDEIKPEKVEVDDKKYEVALRFKRRYTDYVLNLIDVSKEDYPGTNRPRYYASDVRVVLPGAEVDRTHHIWMNNPMRFAGETFYQSQYTVSSLGEESTVLQVVTNTGWMIPYVACMIVVIGMAGHFIITLTRFLRRRDEAEMKVQAELAEAPSLWSQRGPIATWLPLATVLLFGAWLGSKAIPPNYEGQPDLAEFGRLPVMSNDRVKPLDTLARGTLRVVADGETFVDKKDVRQPAIRWLVDVMTDQDADHQVFRVDNLEMKEFFGLEKRKSHRYSLNELLPKYDRFRQEAMRVRALGDAPLDVFDRKVADLDRRLQRYSWLAGALQRPMVLQPYPTADEIRQDPEWAIGRIRKLDAALTKWAKESAKVFAEFEQFKSPKLVPVMGSEDTWDFYPRAATELTWNKRFVKDADENPATAAWDKIILAYAKGTAPQFNDTVAKYHELLAESPPKPLHPDRNDFEAVLNRLSPFHYLAVVYVMAGLIAACGWLGWSRPFNRTAYWLIVFTFVLHTAAIIARVYLSGRPPVTNLYSSAVFIGWAAVLIGLIIESVFHMGIGNSVASVGGFSGLLIANLMASDGTDTFGLLEPVLDTQFWLSTHVITITLGYATTFFAGLLGISYVLRGMFTSSLTPSVSKEFARMTYGVICFATLFSFFGTVLGGLWADDSWGRFWGWDPKENGALIIVLWNALVLHARWAGLVKDRGLAVLAIGGNIVVAWSYFGTNQLGVGLHSYGSTEGTLRALGIFMLSQFVLIGIGCLPKHLWASSNDDPPPPAASKGGPGRRPKPRPRMA